MVTIPFIGRLTELSLVRALIRETLAGRSAILLVGGEDGIGKSRFMKEAALLASQQGLTIHQAKVRKDDPDFPSGLTQLVASLIDRRSEEEVRRALVGLPPSLVSFLSILEPYRSAGSGGFKPLPDPEAERLRLYQGTRLLLLRLIGSQPTFFGCDDLHDSRAGDLKLFGYLARTLTMYSGQASERLPILVLATYRMPLSNGSLARLIDSAKKEGFPFETIRLPSLTERETADLASTLAADIPVALQGELYRKTGGNPVFVVEALKEATSRSGTITSLPDLPSRVQDLVLARLSRFDDQCRRLCRAAAILGDRFTLDLLGEVSGVGLGEMLAAMGRLVEANLFERDHRDRTFRFAHRFVKEAIRESLPDEERGRLHRKVVRLLEGTKLSESGPVLRAYHYEQAGKPEPYVRSLLAAGEKAIARYDGQEAVKSFEKLAEVAGGLPEDDRRRLRDLRIRALRGLVAGFRLLQDGGQAESAARRLLALAREAGDPAALSGAFRSLGEALADLNRSSDALAALDEGLKLAREHGLTLERARAMRVKSDVAKRLGTMGALELIRETIRLAREAGDRELEAEGLVRETVAHIEQGDDDAARRSYMEALRIARTRRLPHLSALARSARGAALSQRGEYVAALKDFQAALAINRRIGDVRSTGRSLVNVASLNAVLGRFDKAILYHKKAAALLRGIGSRSDLAGSLFSIGNIEYDRGRYRRALESFEESLAIWKDQGERPGIAVCMNNMGAAYIELGDFRKAREHLEVSTSLCLELSLTMCGVESNCYLGLVKAIEGEPDRGLEMVERALENARMHDLRPQECLGLCLQGRILGLLGRTSAGADRVKEAIELSLQLGLEPQAARFRKTLQQVLEDGGQNRESR